MLFIYPRFGLPLIRNGHYIVTARRTISLMAAASMVFLVLSVLASSYSFTRVHAVYALIFCVYVLYAQRDVQRRLQAQRDSDIREQLFISHRAQYDMYRENVELVNRKSHDLKHQIAALRALSSSATGDAAVPNSDDTGSAVTPAASQITSALDSIERSVLDYDSFFKTGNEMLDTILNQKQTLCRERGITLTCMADGEALSGMDAVDLFTLLGNILDNAIEAVSPLEPQTRSVQLVIERRFGLVFIREENPCVPGLTITGALPQTSKPDKENHGYGLRSIKFVAEKYDGALSVRAADGLFSLTVTLRIS